MPYRRSRRARTAILPTLVVLATGLVAPAPALADKAPSTSERQAAKNKITLARRAVDSLQSRAELAIEVHNGLRVKALAAARLHERAEQRATAARLALAGAEQAADAAARDAQQAAAEATAAQTAQSEANDNADAARQQLDRLIGAAYRGAGTLGMISQLIRTPNPVELANAHHMINSVSDAQHRTVIALGDARDAAARAADRATAAREAASVAVGRAEQAVRQKDAAVAHYAATNHEAALDAQAARRAVDSAQRARARAARLVAEAQRVLHRAVLTSAQLERAARAARAAAESVRRSVHRSVAPSEAARVAINAAFDHIGVPYSWGGGDENGPTYGFAQGAGTRGFDCSGLTLYAYAQAGIRLDHYSGSQYGQGKRISSRADLVPGDLMFFATDTSNPATIHHVGIYLGNDKILEAPYTGSVVRVGSSIRNDFIGGTRPWA